jgi:hypothetical protein
MLDTATATPCASPSDAAPTPHLGHTGPSLAGVEQSVAVLSTYVDGRMVYVRWTINGQRKTGLVRIDAEDRHDFADASDCPVETDEEQEAIERACLAAFVAEPDDALDRWLRRETLPEIDVVDHFWIETAEAVGGL